MIITSKQQMDLVNKYIEDNPTESEKWSGFVDGVVAGLELVNQLMLKKS